MIGIPEIFEKMAITGNIQDGTRYFEMLPENLHLKFTKIVLKNK